MLASRPADFRSRQLSADFTPHLLTDHRRSLAQWFSEATAAKLNGTVKIKYKNYGGSDKSEAAMIETQHHADVAYYRAGFLTDGLPYNTTSFRVRRDPATPGEQRLP